MRCNICGKFMNLETIYDFISYYRCVDDCDNLIPDFNSEERNMDYVDKVNKIFKYSRS